MNTNRSSFKVTTSVILVLSGVAFFVREFQSSIPPAVTNRLSLENGRFMQQAGHQPIDWRPLNEETFAEARRKSKPILLVIGTEWSRVGRKIDHDSFSDSEIARQIARDFIPVRVDGTERPEWLSTFLPIQRLDLSFLSGFQAWIFAPSGQLLDFIGRSQSGIDLNRETMFQLLLKARAIYDDIALKDGGTELASMQNDDFEEIRRGGSLNSPDFRQFTEYLIGRADTVHGGFPSRGLQPPLPCAWQYLISVGALEQARRSLDPMLLSPLTDLVNGGFYRLCPTVDCRAVELDKLAVTNAQFVELLAGLSALTGDPNYQRLANDAFNWMLNRLTSDGHFATSQIGDELLMERSAFSSYSPKKLRAFLSEDEREWARKNLGLSVRENPQMLAYPTSFSVLSEPKLPDILGKLILAQGPVPELGTSGLLDVDGYVIARLLRAARRLNQPERYRELAPYIENLEVYRSGQDVTHEIRQPSISGTYLGDYLAYSDAMLQDTLTTGRIISFQRGLNVLQRAVSLFQTETAGSYSVGFPIPSSLLPQTSSIPEVADGIRESCSAQMIRLLIDYARLLGPGPASREMSTRASAVVGLFAKLSIASPRLAGYYLAAASTLDSTAAFAVGPKAQEEADRLARLRPSRLVAAVSGPIRPDLQGRPPGIYVVSDASVLGPLTVEKAAQLLPDALRVGVGE